MKYTLGNKNMKSAPEINLVPKIDPEKLENRKKIFYWLSQAGRIVIIFTEAVVLAVFLTRFYFDQKISDLKEGISNKIEILEEKKQIESKAFELYKKSEYFKTIQALSSNYSKSLQNIILLIPRTITMERVSTYEDTAYISAKTEKIEYFSKMIDNFSSNNKISSVILKQVNYITDKNVYYFELELKFTK